MGDVGGGWMDDLQGFVTMPQAWPITVIPKGVSERAIAEPFRGVYQAADNWCWAAVVASVATRYDVPMGATPTVRKQCEIIEEYRKGGNACTSRSRPWCHLFERQQEGEADCVDPEQNRPGFLHRALATFGMLQISIPLRGDRRYAVGPLTVGSKLDFDELMLLISHGYLVCLRSRRRGLRHFIVVYGCQAYPEYSVLVWDPAQGSDVIEAERFAFEYGPFTHKIIAGPPPATASARGAS